jgi:2-oxoglutarate ferredoxin oxidoreductase subunit alpha
VSPKGAYFTRGSGHNQYGAYTEDSAEYQVVLDRLKRKFSTAARYVPKPEVLGKGDNKIGIVSVGSCDGAVREAIDVLTRQKIPVDYMRIKAFPFGHEVESFLSLHATIFVVEQNRDAQLRSLLTLETGVDKSKLKSILSYSGFPMSCEPIVDGIRATLPDAPRLTAVTSKYTR